jgi:hypothetical protein
MTALLFVGGGIWLLAALFPRAGISPENGAESNGDALAILKQRYARGELSKEEFEAIRRDLEQVSVATTKPSVRVFEDVID